MFDTFNTNLFGQVNIVNAILPHMRARRSGTIVNIGSRSAWIDVPVSLVLQSFYITEIQLISGLRTVLRLESGTPW